MARLGQDPCEEEYRVYDANCDGEIDPLDLGYVLARFGTCEPRPECVQDFCD